MCPEDRLNIYWGKWFGIRKIVDIDMVDDRYLNNIIKFCEKYLDGVPYILRLEKRIREIEKELELR